MRAAYGYLHQSLQPAVDYIDAYSLWLFTSILTTYGLLHRCMQPMVFYINPYILGCLHLCLQPMIVNRL